MPDKYSVATYAASASLATIALVYVFAPTFLLDSAPAGSGGGGGALASLTSRKPGVVGLVNAANDCFINSILQALAGLGDLRIYLIRETHRRKVDDAGVYRRAVPADAVLPGEQQQDAGSSDGAAPAPAPAPARQALPVWKIEGLQAGLVTRGLKDMIDQLNERPLYRKVVSARPFVEVLQTAFRKSISRQQQDAQEFLQIVAERLADEYHAGRRARQYARQQAARQAATAAAAAAADQPLNGAAVGERLASLAGEATEETAPRPANGHVNGITNGNTSTNDIDDEEEGFPMEGKLESQIECLTCGFKPRPSGQTFSTLTLNVPQTSATSLSACFDSLLKTEYIDEFKCEKCRLVHAQGLLAAELAKTEQERKAAELRRCVASLQRAIDTDPEQPPADVALPDVRVAPKRRIARHVRLVRFPKILAIHLSRSIFDVGSTSQKNSAKVAFPESLPLGGILQQRRYKLISVVMHKGSHHSGHYESFRRQVVAPPYSNPNVPGPAAVYSPATTPVATTPMATTPKMAATTAGPDSTTNGDSTTETSSLRSLTRSTLSRMAASSSRSGSSSQTSVNGGSSSKTTTTSAQKTEKTEKTETTTAKKTSPPPPSAPRRKKKTPDRWWRISDERVREASTREVLGMQREVYLLFYELERENPYRR